MNNKKQNLVRGRYRNRIGLFVVHQTIMKEEKKDTNYYENSIKYE